jgi:YVTN family beta-propeller protein
MLALDYIRKKYFMRPASPTRVIMKSCFERLCFALIILLYSDFTGMNASGRSQPNAVAQPYDQSIEANGIRINFEVAHVGNPTEPPRSFQEGDSVIFRFAIKDSVTNAPVQGAFPAAWLDIRQDNEIPAANTCEMKVQKFVAGGPFAKPAVDFNDYYVLALNDDATVSVVDPLFGFGNTKLLALVPLTANGYDWVTTRDQNRLFVSVPEKEQIAVIDTTSWEVSKTLDLGFKPARVALQPDGEYLWVAAESGSQPSLAAFRTRTLEPAARLSIGKGDHAIATSSDSSFVFVTNSEDNSVSVIDTRTLEKAIDIQVGQGPVAAAYSDLAKALYVSLAEAGSVAVIDVKSLKVIKTIGADQGVEQIACAPGGQYTFLLNREKDLVQVIDCSVNEIIQSGRVGKAPFQVSFSNDFAYINHIGTADVSMVQLDTVGRKGAPLSVVTFPGGEQSLGKSSTESPIARVVRASGENAVLVANAPDKQVYYYREGMAAPMGSFSNYGREPLGICVIDRSLRERSSRGVYETTTRLPAPGQYDVVFFLDSPKLIHCFDFTVDANPTIEAERNAGAVLVTPLPPRLPSKEGEELGFKFRIVDKASSKPITGLTDVVIVTFLAPGTWHRRDLAKEEANGVYGINFLPPRPGVYYGHIQCSSVNVQLGNPNYITVRVLPGALPKTAEPAGRTNDTSKSGSEH